GKVIANTLRAVVETDYPGEMEIVIVDDGSKDNTAAEIERFIAADTVGTRPAGTRGAPSRVRFLRQENFGKSAALHNAIAHSRHEVLIFLDADTMFERQTIGALVDKLADPRVAAVSGHAKVGNRRNFV